MREGRIGAGEQPVVQRLEGNARLGRLAFDVLMTVEANPRGVGKVGTEFDEQGTEVRVDQIKVVMVAHHRPAGEPRVRLTGVGADLLDHAKTGKPLLGLADVQDTLRLSEVAEPLAGHVVFALYLGEGHDLHALALRKPIDRLDEGAADRGHQHRGGDLGTAMDLEEVGDPAAGLQPRLIQVEIQPIDSFELQRDPIVQQLCDGLD
ncbi:hypothetical protein [Thiocapsa bogorovii]|uniref:hypothetical protein n=1 Tax=Thiocapsa bogorovii TaxID=521689 RepID=UPI002FC9BE4B